MYELALVEIRHPIAHMLQPNESMQPWNESYFFLFFVQQIEECATLAELRENVEVIIRR